MKKQWTFSYYVTQENPDEKMVELTHYKGYGKTVKVPAMFGKYRLGMISGSLLSGHDDVTELVLPDGDYQIGCSLKNCRGMADSKGFIVVQAGDRRVLTDYIGDRDLDVLSLPDGITEINDSVFRNLYIREFAIPDSYRLLPNLTFWECERLQRVVLPEGLKEIRYLGFYNCKLLKEVYIPDSVTAINSDSNFRVCGSRGSEAEAFAKRKNLEFLEQGVSGNQKPLPDLVIEKGILERYLGEESIVTIPEGVVAIGNGAFHGCSTITDIVIPEGVEVIEWGAFDECHSLTTLLLPGTVKEIKNYAFSWCGKLKEIILPKKLEKIGENAFMECRSITEILIPDGVQSIGEEAFSCCKNLKKVFLPKSLQEIGKDAFTNEYSGDNKCDLIEIHASIGSYAQKYAEDNNLKFLAE